jgi:uncharacterized protein YndB with AHSA1/START domain
MAQATTKEGSAELTITRIFDAPRELVWKAWTEPDRVKRWWGPKSFTVPIIKIDLRIGGKCLYLMRSPEGQDFWSTGTYREIVPNEKIIVTDSFADEKGNVVPASLYGMTGDWPLELVVTVTFEAKDGKTKFTLRHAGLPEGEMRDMTKVGWNESFDKLEKVLVEEKSRRGNTIFVAEPGKQEAYVVRIFDAPRERLFQAYTDPKLMARWWGPRRYTIIVDKMDVKPGGVWRIINRDAEGNDYVFHGVYHEVSRPSRLVYTFEWEGMPGHVQLGIVTFEDVDGRTRVTDKSIFETIEDRDGMVQSMTEEEGQEIYDRLAEVVEKK